jgi:hypothetical protein
MKDVFSRRSSSRPQPMERGCPARFVAFPQSEATEILRHDAGGAPALHCSSTDTFNCTRYIPQTVVSSRAWRIIATLEKKAFPFISITKRRVINAYQETFDRCRVGGFPGGG